MPLSEEFVSVLLRRIELGEGANCFFLDAGEAEGALGAIVTDGDTTNFSPLSF